MLLDPTNGVRGLRDQLAELAQAVSADSVTLVDVGGDIIAQGDEPELIRDAAVGHWPRDDLLSSRSRSPLDFLVQLCH